MSVQSNVKVQAEADVDYFPTAESNQCIVGRKREINNTKRVHSSWEHCAPIHQHVLPSYMGNVVSDRSCRRPKQSENERAVHLI